MGPTEDEQLADFETNESNPPSVPQTEQTTAHSRHIVRDANIGSTIDDRYFIQSLLGRGATSSVYAARDLQKQQAVAVKLMHSHLISEETICRRFEQEAKTARLLQHPNIVQIYAYSVSANGIPFIAMELVEGTSLQDVIKGAGWLPVSRTYAIILQVSAALAVAHEKSVVHRDLKPANIMLTNTVDGELLVKVLDFGIAKQMLIDGDTAMRLTQSGETLGSLLYMSPEQCLDQDLDSRSDCYSLGCVMYEMLTGKPPLCARTAFETMNKQISEMPERLDRVRPDLVWPAGVQELISKTLAKDPGQRYQKITDLLDDVQKLSKGEKPHVNPVVVILQQSEVTMLEKSAVQKERTSPKQLKTVHEYPDALQTSINRLREPGRLDEMVNGAKFWCDFSSFCIGFYLFSVVAAALIFRSNREIATIIGFFLLLFFPIVLMIRGVTKLDFDKTTYAVSAIRDGEVASIFVNRIYQAVPSTEYYSTLFVECTTDESANQTKLTIGPQKQEAPIWATLCHESHLTIVTGRNDAFPVPALLFSDLQGEPAVLDIGGSLAWVKSSETMKRPE